MAFYGEVDMSSKDLSLPGFPNCISCQLHTLQYKYDWTEEQLDWVRKNWIHDHDDFYMKPDTLNTKSNTLKGSHEKDEDLLKTILKNEVSMGKYMDDNNKKALDVMSNKGINEAGKYMMTQAGGNYAKMRSMFG